MVKSETSDATPKLFGEQHRIEVFLGLLRGEDIELVSSEVGRTAAELSRRKEAFIVAGSE